jgi:hypothetical protein
MNRKIEKRNNLLNLKIAIKIERQRDILNQLNNISSESQKTNEITNQLTPIELRASQSSMKTLIQHNLQTILSPVEAISFFQTISNDLQKIVFINSSFGKIKKEFSDAYNKSIALASDFGDFMNEFVLKFNQSKGTMGAQLVPAGGQQQQGPNPGPQPNPNQAPQPQPNPSGVVLLHKELSPNGLNKSEFQKVQLIATILAIPIVIVSTPSKQNPNPGPSDVTITSLKKTINRLLKIVKEAETGGSYNTNENLNIIHRYTNITGIQIVDEYLQMVFQNFQNNWPKNP